MIGSHQNLIRKPRSIFSSFVTAFFRFPKTGSHIYENKELKSQKIPKRQAPSAKLEKGEQKSRSEFENLEFLIKEKNSCWDSIVTWHNL